MTGILSPCFILFNSEYFVIGVLFYSFSYFTHCNFFKVCCVLYVFCITFLLDTLLVNVLFSFAVSVAVACFYINILIYTFKASVVYMLLLLLFFLPFLLADPGSEIFALNLVSV